MRTCATSHKSGSHAFNMVEVILALVIVLLGVVSLMALFPIGNNATRDAIGQSAAADAGSQFLSYFSSKIKQRWALVNALPLTKAGADESLVNWKSADANGIISGVEGLAIFYNDEDNDGKFDYMIQAPTDLSRDDSGLFLLRQSTSQSLDDFSAVLRVWKSPAQFNSLSASATTVGSVPPSTGIVLHVEVSWPEALPYDRRQKAVFKTDVFRPNENLVAEVQGAFQITEAGTLKVTYHGSDAGWRSELWMSYPDEEQLFDTNKPNDQSVVTKSYKAGDEFNFHTVTHSPKFGVYSHYAWAPEPIVCDCKCRHFSGELNLNPNNSPQNEFMMRVPAELDPENGDGLITRDDLHSQSPHDSNGVYYRGPATYIRALPKGNGNQNSFMVDGTVYKLSNGTRYIFESAEMNVVLYNSHIKNGKAMGKWWLKVDSDCGSILTDGQVHDERCAILPQNRGTASLGQDIPYYDDWPKKKYTGAFDVVSGNPYALIAELEPARKWLIRFEDQPGWSGCDWDYNDIVISVEILVEDGISEDLTGVAVSGDVNLNPNGNADWSFNAVTSHGELITSNTIGGGYDGPAVSLWISPRGPGNQTIEVDGENMQVNNSSMISVSSTSMNLRLYKSGSTWRASFSSPKATFTVME